MCSIKYLLTWLANDNMEQLSVGNWFRYPTLHLEKKLSGHEALTLLNRSTKGLKAIQEAIYGINKSSILIEKQYNKFSRRNCHS